MTTNDKNIRLVDAQEAMQVRRVAKTVTFDGDAAAAALSTSLTGTNNDLDYTADASGVAGNGISVEYIAPTTPSAALSVSVTGKKITVNLATGAGTAEQQTVTVIGGGGTFTLGFKDQNTSPIAYDASAATVQAALRILPGLEAVTVAKSSNVYTVTFAGAASGADQPLIYGNISDMKPYATPGIAIATSVAGDDDPATDEQQTVTITNAASGVFRLTYSGQTTAPINYGATATEVANALKALSNIGNSDVGVAKSGDVYTVTFQGALAATNVAEMTASNGLRGTRTITVAQSVSSVAPAITSTAAEVKAAIEANTTAVALVNIANKSGNDGTGVVTALTETALAGGKAGYGATEAAQNLFKSLDGNCLTTLVGIVETDLASGGSATLAHGRTGKSDAFTTGIAFAGLDKNDMIDTTGEVASGTAPNLTPKIPVLEGEYITMTPATADVSGGSITYYCYYIPLDDGARMVAV